MAKSIYYEKIYGQEFEKVKMVSPRILVKYQSSIFLREIIYFPEQTMV